MEKLLFELNDVAQNRALEKLAGGKACGLVQGLQYAKELQDLGIDVNVPKTFVLSNYGHGAYKEAGKVPNNVLVAAVKAMHAAGGNVAVRSSADIEDGSDKSYSGEFESVLNVATVEEMRQALEIVYNSADNVVLKNGQLPKMSIVIQQMIEKPDYAGVVYSEDFNGDPFIVINRVKGRTADKLVKGEENSEIIKLSKFFLKDNDYEKYDFRLLTPDELANLGDDDAIYYQFVIDNKKKMGIQNKKDINKLHGNAVLPIIALINYLEMKSGHPIDMEFAVKDDKIYILQQRSYLNNPNFIIKSLPNGDIVGYNKDAPIITSEMLGWDNPVFKTGEKLRDLQGYILCFTKVSEYKKEFYNTVQTVTYGEIRADLIVDNYGILTNKLYNHYGNKLREAGQPFWMSRKGDALSGVKAGERLRIDLSKGTIERVSNNIAMFKERNSR